MCRERQRYRCGLDSVLKRDLTALRGSKTHFFPAQRKRVVAFYLIVALGSLLAANPAATQQAVSVVGSPGPVERNNESDCSFPLGHCAQIRTIVPLATVDLTNSGNFDAGLNGIFTLTEGIAASIGIENTGGIRAANDGISATAFGAGS